MQIPNSPFFTDYSTDFPITDHDLEDESSFSSIGKIFNYWPISSDESENIDKLYFIKPIGINKDRKYFKTELLKQKRGKNLLS